MSSDYYYYNKSVCQHSTDIMKPKANYLVKYNGTSKINKKHITELIPSSTLQNQYN